MSLLNHLSQAQKKVDERQRIAPTQQFVRSQRLGKIGDVPALFTSDGSIRLFAELFADPDRPIVRPQDAYLNLLSSCQPGWSLRLLQILWPNSEPRQAFAEMVAQWGSGLLKGKDDPELNEGRVLLQKGLMLDLEEITMPFSRRVILEFNYAGEESLAWWQGLPGMFVSHFVQFRPLTQIEILELVRETFHPDLGE